MHRLLLLLLVATNISDIEGIGNGGYPAPPKVKSINAMGPLFGAPNPSDSPWRSAVTINSGSGGPATVAAPTPAPASTAPPTPSAAPTPAPASSAAPTQPPGPTTEAPTPAPMPSAAPASSAAPTQPPGPTTAAPTPSPSSTEAPTAPPGPATIVIVVPTPGNTPPPPPSSTGAPTPGSVTAGPVGQGSTVGTNMANVKSSDLDYLPKDPNAPNAPQTKIEDLPDNYAVFPGQNDLSRIVANNKFVYVLHPTQTKKNDLLYDPWTIGQVLGYIYEYAEFGGVPPPDGYTITLMGGAIPTRWKRFPSKYRRGTLVFTPKSKENQYWTDVLKNRQ